MIRQKWLVLFLLLALGLPGWRLPQPQSQEATPTTSGRVLSPRAGQVLQGVVPVMVNTADRGFLSSELYFAYADDPTNTWFLLAQQNVILRNAAMASWDTSTISDGDYMLRLVITVRDQPQIITDIGGLRVRNYTPAETDTPTPPPTPLPGDLLTATATPEPSRTPIPLTATPLPTNPASLSGAQVTVSLGRGALGALGIFVLVGLYLAVRRGLRGR